MTTLSIHSINTLFNSLFSGSISTPKPATTGKQIRQQKNISNQLMAYLHEQNKLVTQNRANMSDKAISHSNRANKFWQTIAKTIADGTLTLADINDTTSQDLIALNHERITALLDEQGLPFADLSPVLFSVIISQSLPTAKLARVASAHSIECDGKTGTAEKRLAYQVPKAELINLLKYHNQQLPAVA